VQLDWQIPRALERGQVSAARAVSRDIPQALAQLLVHSLRVGGAHEHIDVGEAALARLVYARHRARGPLEQHDTHAQIHHFSHLALGRAERPQRGCSLFIEQRANA